ncbi:MAG: DUF5320 domain-containing protein [Nanoarchaeota archaeon]|nr:DUF5320 domain-containing protein [Nanoarchaeota archaeon]
MPGFDGTGPNGRGPMTGRGMGPCGKGMRRGFGRFRLTRSITKKDEKEMLESEREEINKRLKELED